MITKLFFYALVSGIFVLLVFRAIDIKVASRDRMLCNSAKVSGNIEYLELCKCFYSGDDISCIYNK